MSKAFREYVRKVGSGPHTGEVLSREEAAIATRLMLLQEATPAQIGAFMIAHRMRRPTGEELAGMLDAYYELGPRLSAIADPVIVMGHPYDGRSRTAPLAPLVAMILAAAGLHVVVHGGDRMPTKEGISLIELWQGLGVDWRDLSLDQVQQVLASTGIGFVYLPKHFPLAQALVPYREEIGKRPPFATMELMWSPYAGQALQICGFVHPPTENMFRTALELHGVTQFTAVKGLEGSCDLPRDRTSIIGVSRNGDFERLTLHPEEFGYLAKELALPASDAELFAAYEGAIAGHPSEMMNAVVWTAGFYLWHTGKSDSLKSALSLAKELLEIGAVRGKLQMLQKAIELATDKAMAVV
jgi:anthranilate phosphoribosyltransferase